MISIRDFVTVLLLSFSIAGVGLSQPRSSGQTGLLPSPSTITFIELGSLSCIPCRAMQPIMKSIEERYEGRVKVIFHDIMKQDSRHYAREFSVRLIPTQIFLDSAGTELMRHEGFFPEKEIDAFLQSRGVHPRPSPQG